MRPLQLLPSFRETGGPCKIVPWPQADAFSPGGFWEKPGPPGRLGRGPFGGPFPPKNFSCFSSFPPIPRGRRGFELQISIPGGFPFCLTSEPPSSKTRPGTGVSPGAGGRDIPPFCCKWSPLKSPQLWGPEMTFSSSPPGARFFPRQKTPINASRGFLGP